MNKIDCVEREKVLETLAKLAVFDLPIIPLSAETGEGIDQLVDRIAHVASAQDTHLDVVVPYQRGDLVSKAHERCRILTEEHIETGTHLTMLVPKAYVDEFRSLSDAKQ